MSENERPQASRRVVLQAGLAAIGAGAATVAATRARAERLAPQRFAQDKLAQNLVQYQEQPKGEQECDKCVNWVAPNACKIVAGTINPKGWCVAFAPQGG
jgi:hypothetical protein